MSVRDDITRASGPGHSPRWRRWLVLGALLLLFASPAEAQRPKPKKRPAPKAEPAAKVKEETRKNGKVQSFDFTGINLTATMRTPQLLYFLDRASEELQRASLKRRSFVPEMVRSISEEGL